MEVKMGDKLITLQEKPVPFGPCSKLLPRVEGKYKTRRTSVNSFNQGGPGQFYLWTAF